MKIGIITFHHTTNYGATLQAYALSKTLASWGHTVEVIDYRPKGAVAFYLRQLLPVRNRKLDWNLNFHKHILKALQMRKFLVSSLSLSKLKCYSSDKLREIFEGSNYDAVITGSDQVWCLDTKFRGFDASYFLDFFGKTDNCLKVSYAPSVGGTQSFKNNREQVSKLLAEFDHVSVRDYHSARVIQEECGIAPTKVLDPTFLVDYEDVLVPPKAKNPYLLVYNHKELGHIQKKAIQGIAESRNLKVISIGDAWDVADDSFISVHPREWIGYFKHASYIFTNTFHGTIFSLLFRKDFTVFVGKGKRNKVFDLLTPLDLKGRIITELTGDYKVDGSQIDYDFVYKKLSPQIDNSKAFLAKALNRVCLPV
ncbi:polysaccharide pyruvyl transferase family protein [Leptolyngbyaceae cyanobacterium CCMR0082]|uniref:Polysaccharide pyruvyl transferase family protein n=1 Tax=Adonisia turfae CCMR0082 TaxID=2304604 RepID=A0A6M0SI64_9CYAN|nr:polysaccharide pyruvyl transferase family protein [Adonisia turfae]NEZ67651.1 polysaccharide pyruvyl transferase family protein [Adonisia turfae CCMR0082]